MEFIIGSQDERVLTSLGRSVSMDIPRDINEFNMFLTSSELYREIEANKRILKKIRSTITHNYISLLNNFYIFILCNSAGYALDIISNEVTKEYLNYIKLKRGAGFREDNMGTNAVSLSVRYRVPVMLDIGDSYSYVLRKWRMICMPLYNMEPGNPLYIAMATMDSHELKPEILYSIQSIINLGENKTILSPAEKQILSMVSQGCERTEICDKLFISNSTVKRHISDIKEKLSEDNIYMCVIKAIQFGMIDSFGNIIK